MPSQINKQIKILQSKMEIERNLEEKKIIIMINQLIDKKLEITNLIISTNQLLNLGKQINKEKSEISVNNKMFLGDANPIKRRKDISP